MSKSLRLLLPLAFALLLSSAARAQPVTVTGSLAELDLCCQDGFWNPGERLEYTFDVTNVDVTTISPVRFEAPVPMDTTLLAASVTTTIPGTVLSGNFVGDTTVRVEWPSLAPGQVQRIRYRVRVDGCHPEGLAFLRHEPAEVYGRPGFLFLAESEPVDLPTTDPEFTGASLVLSKSDGGRVATVGDIVPYTLSYLNSFLNSVGFRSATTRLQETVPVGSIFAPASSTPGWLCAPLAGTAGATCTLSIGPLDCGDSGSAVFAVQVAPPFALGQTQLDNTGLIRSDLTIKTASDTTPLTGIGPDAAISKSANRTSVGAGQAIVYTLAVSNVGNTAGTITVSENVPAGTTFLPGSSSPGWSCSGSTCTLSVGSVAAGGSASVAFAVQTASPLPSGLTQIANTATVSTPGDLSSANNSASVSVPIASAARPDLVTTKSTSASVATAGAIVSYTLTVTNTGQQVAGAISLTETVPVATTFVAGSSSSGWTCAPPAGAAGATCTLSIGSVSPGTPVVRTFAVRVAEPIPSGVDAITNAATATSGSDPDSDPSDNGSTPVVTPIDPGSRPDLEITKTAGSPTAIAGGVLVYTLAVTNSGHQVAGSVEVTETVPASTSFVAASSSPAWVCAPPAGIAGAVCTLGLGNVAPGATLTRTFAVRVADPLPSGVTAISNAVTVESPIDPDSDPGDAPPPVTTPIDPASRPDLEVVKTSGSATVRPGDVVTYTLTVTNAGHQVAGDSVLEETVPEATAFSAAASSPGWVCAPPSGGAGARCTLDLGDVAPGASIVRSFAVQVEDPLRSGLEAISNGVTVSSVDPDADPGDAPAPVTTPVDPSVGPDLEVAKTAGSATAVPGEVLVYSVTVTNTGDQVAGDVVVTETIPEATTFEPTASSSGWACSPPAGAAGAVCLLDVGDIVPGMPVVRTLAVRIDDPLPSGIASIMNSVTVSSPVDPDTDPDDGPPPVATPVDPAAGPDLEVTKIAGVATTLPGDVLVFTLTARNAGNQVAGGVVLTETVSQATTFEPSSSSSGWVCSPPTGEAGATCELELGDLVPGADVVRTFAVRVDDPLPSGVRSITNAVTVSSPTDPDTDPGDEPPPIDVPVDPAAGPDLEVTKTSAQASAVAGEVILYTLTVGNSGDQVAGDVSLTERVPTASSFEPSASSPGWTCLPPAGGAGATCTLDLGNVAPNVAIVRTFAVRVDDPLSSGVREVSNSVTVSSATDPDADPGDDPPPVTIPVDPGSLPDLEVTKSTPATSARAGQLLVYTLTAGNAGHQVASDVALTEVVPLGTTFEPSSSSAGWSCSPLVGPAGASCTLSIGNVPPGAVVLRAFAVRVDDPIPPGLVEITNSVGVSSSVDPDADPDDDPPPVTIPVDPGDEPPPPPPPPPGEGGPDVSVAADAGFPTETWLVTGFVSTRDPIDLPIDVILSFDPTLLEPLDDGGPTAPIGVGPWLCEQTPSGAFVGRCTRRLFSLAAGETLELSMLFAVLSNGATVWASFEAWPVGAADTNPADNVATVSAETSARGVVDIPTLSEWGLIALVVALGGLGTRVLRRLGGGFALPSGRA